MSHEPRVFSATPWTFSAARICAACMGTFPYPLVDEAAWSTITAGGSYWRCPGCTELGRSFYVVDHPTKGPHEY